MSYSETQSLTLAAAVTGVTKTATFRLYKNGTLLHADFDLAFTSAGAETNKRALVAKDLRTFDAGDLLQVVYTSDTITNTPKAWAVVEIEC